MTQAEHRPVMLGPALEALQVRPEGTYVDGTYGRGGHAAALLERLGSRGRLWLVDRDPDAVALARARHGQDPRVTIVHDSFGGLGERLRRAGLGGAVSGLLLDLGVSSPQLDDATRGFSFLRDGPLDMRMDNSQGETAADWLARVDVRTLAGVLRDYGEERHARRIARAIAAARERGGLPRTTADLAALIEAAVPGREPGRHPATRSFQAIRIHLNAELEALDRLLDSVCGLLEPGGRFVAISFHSLEDRRVKRFIRRYSEVGDLPPGAGAVPPERQPRLRRIGGARRADADEVAANPRARSAVMRTAERLP